MQLSFDEEFRYLGHTTADCRDDKNIKKQFMRQNAVGNMLVWRNATCHLVALTIIQATSAPNLIITSINLNQSPI